MNKLDQLLDLHDVAFIDAAYNLFLGRSADPSGKAYYLKRLRNGKEKRLLLTEIYCSNEFKQRVKLQPELTSMKPFIWLEWPFFGRPLYLLAQWLENSRDRKRLRVIENQVYATEVSIKEIFSNLSRSNQDVISRFEKNKGITSSFDKYGVSDDKTTYEIAGKTHYRKNGKSAKGVIYLYVDHTILCPANTGVQRTVRMIARSLLEMQEDVRFVKWDNAKNNIVFIKRTELMSLAQWNGPDPSMVDLQFYSESDDNNECQGLIDGSDCWLLVPEVPHINFHGAQLTAPLIARAKQLGLVSVFMFYDAIPLHRKELESIADIHLQYMIDLEEADLILPISEWSKSSYIKHTQGHIEKSPEISTFLLPSESILAERQENPDELIKNAKNIILSVGSVTEHKNQLALIRAFNSYCKKNPETSWVLNLVGHVHPDLSDRLEALIRKNNRVVRVDGVTDELLCDAYRDCAFTVFPSVEEGYGLPIVESLWFGKPCVCANFGAMREIGDKDGVIQIDTRDEALIEETIQSLIENKEYRHSLYRPISKQYLYTWKDYTERLSFKLKERYFEILGRQPQKNQGRAGSKKRVFWLGMHKVLVQTELYRLRELGYEVFNPAYLSDVVDQSADLNWDEMQDTTLPKDVFDTLANTNFFYTKLSDEICEILNEYFDAIIVTIAPVWLEPIVKGYNGCIIYRVYGQAHSITDEFVGRDMQKHVENNEKFFFLPHAAEAVVEEAQFFRHNEFVVPYCLVNDVFGYQDSWDRRYVINGEVAVTCPNISNDFFRGHYDFLKERYNRYFIKLYGVQVEHIEDNAVVGSIPRKDLLERWTKISCYIYTYDDPRVCYLPPIEVMVIGAPVLFCCGSLLDKYFVGIDTPARFNSPEEALILCDRIRSGDFHLIDEILKHQKNIRKKYTPSTVWPAFDRVITSLI